MKFFEKYLRRLMREELDRRESQVFLGDLVASKSWEKSSTNQCGAEEIISGIYTRECDEELTLLNTFFPEDYKDCKHVEQAFEVNLEKLLLQRLINVDSIVYFTVNGNYNFITRCIKCGDLLNLYTTCVHSWDYMRTK